MDFQKLITRLDEEFVQTIVGKDVLSILNILDPNLSRLQKLQEVLLTIYSPLELIQDKDIRNLFIDVLKVEEIKDLSNKLGVNFDDNVYSNLKKINYNKDYEKSILYEFLGINLPEKEKPLELEYKENISCNYPLFLHQREALTEVSTKLYTDNRKVLLHMPTGSGKTRTAMNAVCNHLRYSEPTLVIWFANTEELCGQAYEEFSKAWKYLGNRELKTVKFWGASKENISEVRDGVIIAGLAKTYELLKSDLSIFSKLATRLTLIVMDEAHMSIAPTYKSILEILTSSNSSLLGLSATPGRTWNDPTADIELADFFDRRKVTLKIEGFSNPVEYLIDRGYLAKILNRPLLYSSGLKLTPKDIDYLKDYLQLPEDILQRISEDKQRNIRIIQEIENLIERHKRIILFAINVEHSNLLATILQARSVNAFSITSKTDPAQRKELIKLFKSDDSQSLVLCNYGILTTGFDAPKTSCAVIARPTDSLVLYSQMVGRAIRGTNAGGNSEAEIVTVIDTALPGFDKIESAFFNWEDVWN
ncbi:DEAD/DEAH box helicase [uncultured Pontibacter sp.]|uniref:DEAD/DEAH box helicase n=1 Tax=uncultured Pontibacter sp. TaxID=453356 RepID=UPI00262EA7D4|nr:DEAD/DEAH box helicase [uncultured Pontibacter sp.]